MAIEERIAAPAQTERVNVTIYRYAGQHGPFFIPSHKCEECDLSISSVNRLAAEIDPDCFHVEVKSWFFQWWKPLLKGGWHPPIITIDNEIFSQGIVPDAEKLRSIMIEAAERRLAICAPDLTAA